MEGTTTSSWPKRSIVLLLVLVLVALQLCTFHTAVAPDSAITIRTPGDDERRTHWPDSTDWLGNQSSARLGWWDRPARMFKHTDEGDAVSQVISEHEHSTVEGDRNYSTTPSRKTATYGMDIIHDAFLQYSKQLQANKEGVEFNASFTLSASGEACFTFTVSNSKTDVCPYPYIRVRLSGEALVHVPLRRQGDGSTFDGCSLLPVPGTYYVDANLIHCRMNCNYNKKGGPGFRDLSGKPVVPDLDVIFTPHKFEMPTFVRNSTRLGQRPRNAFPNHAWVFAPTCPDSEYVVSESCARKKTPSFIPAKFQVNDWLRNHNYSSFFSPEVHRRFDDYMWLPVNPINGIIDFNAEHFSQNYTPMPSFLQESKGGHHNQTILFVGASHVRYLRNQVSQIYYNLTYGHDGCVEGHTIPPDLSGNVSRFGYYKVHMAPMFLKTPLQAIIDEVGDHYDKYVISYGQWDSSWARGFPLPPKSFLKAFRKVLTFIQELAKPEAEIFVLSLNQNGMGGQALKGTDWRVPPLLDAYNDNIWSQVTVDDPITSSRSFRFINFNRTYLLDNSDIANPIWDSATDFCHPCRYSTRPIALRVLNLLKE